MTTMNRILLFVLFSILMGFVSAQQDTLRMMQYNLMYYTNNSGVSDCNSTTNNLNDKDLNIKTIFRYVMPDVFCVCEMGSNNTYADRLLNNAINTDGIDYYRRGVLTNYSGGTIANMIYYNSRKLSPYQNYTISTSYRDINGYKMYYNSTDLPNGDTVFITFWVMHLKAGSYDDNEYARYVQVQKLMNKMVSLGAPGNNIVSGDFNIYGASEPAYQELTNYDNSLYRFYDPIDRPGEWNNNSQFADIHTQSTHTESTGCFSTGGLDDRFDFILVSPYVYYGTEGVRVLPETYHALGQDGHHYNGMVNQPQNTAVPTNVANALYNQSDHLPVVTDFLIDGHVGVTALQNDFLLKVANPITDHLTIFLHNNQSDQFSFDIYSIDGKLVSHFDETLEEGPQTLDYPTHLTHGFYFLKVTNSKGQSQVVKLVR